MNRAWLVALAITALMLMGAVAAATSAEAATPKKGQVTIQIYYTSGGVQVAPANNSELTTVTYGNGYQIASGTGPHPLFKLNYGTYVVKQAAILVPVAGLGQSIASAVRTNLTVNSASQTVLIDVPVVVTHIVQFNVSNITRGESVLASFQTVSGFQFISPMKVAWNKSYNISLPSEEIYTYLNYGGASYVYENTIGSTQTKLSLALSGSSDKVFGFVQTAGGVPISGISAVILNTSSNSYTVAKFSGSSFSLFSSDWAHDTLIIGANGYMPKIITNINPGSHGLNIPVTLKKQNSTILYTYNLSSDMKTLKLNITYSLGPGSSIPQLPNATVNLLGEQLDLDHVTTSYMKSFLNSLMLQYTNYTIEVSGFSYKLSNSPVVTAYSLSKASIGSAYFNASVTATYTNSTIKASNYKSGFNVKIYAFGNTYSSAKISTNYTLIYNNTALALTSSSVKTKTYVSPVVVPGQSNSGWITLSFGKKKGPKFYDTRIDLHWTKLASSNYLLNSSSHPAFIVPWNVSVSFNLSKAFYNPVTGTYNYLPPANFTWYLGSTLIGYGYNFSYTFNALHNNTVKIKGISYTGNSTTTFFTVYAYNLTPYVNYSVQYKGKYAYNASLGNLNQVSINVPQSALVTFSVYNSSVIIPNSANFTVPLLYNWTFNNSLFTSPNATHIFSYPSVKYPNQMVNVTVSTITGQSKAFKFLVYVNDTSPPTPVISMTNASSGKTISNPTAGYAVIFKGSKSTDPYYNNYPLSYKWSFHYANRTQIKNNSGIFSVVSGNLNSSTVQVKFKTLTSLTVQLNVTNHVNITGRLNKSLVMLVSSPWLVVTGVHVNSTLQQGKSAQIFVNITNKGTVKAKSFSIAVYINGVMEHQQFYNSPINRSQPRNVTFLWTPSTSGTDISVQFVANNTSEPAFFGKLGGKPVTLTIIGPAYKTPLIIGGIVAVIVIVGVVYWRLSSRGPRRSKGSEQQAKAKVSLPSEQKKLEKKK